MLDEIHEFSDLVTQDELERLRQESDARVALAESDALLDRLNSEFRDVPLHSGETNVDSLNKCLAKAAQPVAFGPAPQVSRTQTSRVPSQSHLLWKKKLNAYFEIDDPSVDQLLRQHYGVE
jgi:hypothetical protein